FRNRPSRSDILLLNEILVTAWGEMPRTLDPTAGGGSIPYEAIRYGIQAFANDLNPVAALVLRASLDYSSRFGVKLQDDVSFWGNRLVRRVTERLLPFFRLPDQSSDNNSYIFARTVACPRTGKPVPLSPNWWLARGKKPAAVRLITQRDGRDLEEVEVEIVTGREIDFDPNRGTVSGGDGISPWDGLAIEGEYIKKEAQAGRMGQQLYAVAIRTRAGRGFRPPTRVDIEALAAAERELDRLLLRWLDEGIIPGESIPDGLKTSEPRRYGILRWPDMFSPRQLLVHGSFVEEFRKIVPEIREALGREKGDAVATLLALMQPKAINYDAILASWHVSRETMRSVFERHDFAFKWTFAEFEGARELYPWCLEQIVDAYSGIAGLLEPSDAGGVLRSESLRVPAPVTVSARNAADLSHIDDSSVELVCIDPPYYDNVMYAELADFFYVWEKRTLGELHPDLFSEELTDKKNEAVANVARFADAGRRKKELAEADYEAKMKAIFDECGRVLRDDGVLTVMFTHKRAAAWDTLGMALMEAGFTVETSWPVNTESEHSLHQAKKNSAASTIYLVCRKREVTTEDRPFFEDLEPEVRAAARRALEDFSQAGIDGVDLLLSTYGPALSVISSRWPVYSSEADEQGRARLLRPEQALEAARGEVMRLRRQRLIGKPVQLDSYTDFALLAWDTFRAAEFPYDEARRLALAVGGLDVEDLAEAKLVQKKAGMVELLPPEKRVRRGAEAPTGVRPTSTSFVYPIDAVHTVMYVADVDGMQAAKALVDRGRLASDPRFLACLQGLVKAVPRTKEKGEWVRKEAATLDRLCAAYFPDIEVPPDPLEVEQEQFSV
ncbi:MAG TPA: DUF1156 domain-containing protein, partial [Actinomycetota bacterium]|nr:DUF1156 domain-containing protein [Actinomycetota bacterium]